MISWWLGRPALDAPKDEDDLDAPETPAPVFAARALKSAIFGTPGLHGDDGDDGDDDDEDSPTRKQTPMAPPTASDFTHRASVSSPIKPQGILLTPGTAATRRKNVSFGAAVIDNEAKTIGKSGVPYNCPGKFPSPWTPKVEGAQRKTSLMKTMEAVREGKSKSGYEIPTSQSLLYLDHGSEERGKFGASTNAMSSSEKSRKRVRSSSLESFDGDMTLDLNEPRSQSGRYWKSEYEKYHEEAKAQMKKLVKYKQLAKSYAKKKDGEAIDLSQKLKEERQRVLVMEDTIADLIAQIADRNTTGEEESPRLMRELARQTTLAIQYRNQVDKFQATLKDKEENSDEHITNSQKHTTKPLLETENELRRARKQLGEMSSLRSEMHSLRLDLQAAEKKTIRLREENAKLERDFHQVDKDLRSCEERRVSTEKSLQQCRNDYDALKELAKSQRRNAEHLLQRRHDQVVGLRKQIKDLTQASSQDENFRLKEEIARLKEAAEARGRMKPTIRPENNINGKGAQIQEGQLSLNGGSGDPINLISEEIPEREGLLNRVSKHTRLENTKRSRPLSRDGESLLDSKIPMLPSSSMKNKFATVNSQRQNENTAPKTIIKRASQPILRNTSDNNEVVERPQTADAKTQDSPFSTSLYDRLSNLSLESPASRLPSLEPPLIQPTIQTVKSKPLVLSPRPSMFNIASSPPKYTLPCPRASGKGNENRIPSSRLSSMSSSRSRTALPPERAAAAKARLEHKKKEKYESEKNKVPDVHYHGEDKENLFL